MTVTYHQFEEEVFNYLWAKHQADKEFKFTVRQVASKKALGDYFIGTEESKYFGFTCWDIPVFFPGSSADLTNFIFWKDESTYHFKFQYLMSKGATGTQSEGDLEFGKVLIKKLESAGIVITVNDEKNKMLFMQINPPSSGYPTINELMKAFDNFYRIIAPIVEESIEENKVRNPEWQTNRLTQEKFEKLIQKMHNRIGKYGEIDRGKENDGKQKQIVPFSKSKTNDENPPLNTILYGPPGTGKTYNTINKSIAIIENCTEEFLLNSYDNRKHLKAKFEELYIDDWDNPLGQIAFITFHQSMSYEDFIEGIKPLKPKENEHLKYDIEDGIFKKICKRAASNYESSLLKNKGKMPFEDAFEQLKEEWENNPSIKFPLKTQGYDFTIIGFSNTSIHFKKASGGTSHTLSINTLKEIYYGKEIDFKEGIGIYYASVLNKLLFYQKDKVSKTNILNYVLIIDEINRGNVSQIFGELITLVEDDKRIGKQEQLQIMLPYSKEKFSVPPNLYLLGTMNTADRSVEALDAALRRRFEFEEMMPKPELISPQRMIWKLWWDYKDVGWEDKNYLEIEKELYTLLGVPEDFDEEDKKEEKWQPMHEEGINENQIEAFNDIDFTGINYQLLLTKINERIEKILSKDQQIGHAFFINALSLEKLYVVFYRKIIPQLQEYFYGDFGKIGLILGNAFIKTQNSVVQFANFDYEDKELLQERKVYEINTFKNNGQLDMTEFIKAVRDIYLPNT